MLPDDNHDKIIKQIEDGEKLKQSVSEFSLPFACVPWGHHVRIVQHSKTIEKALFYVSYTIREGISRDTLKKMVFDVKDVARIHWGNHKMAFMLVKLKDLKRIEECC